MASDVVKKTESHLEDMGEIIADSFIGKKIEEEVKTKDGNAIMKFIHSDDDKIKKVKLRLYFGDKSQYGDRIDELWIKKGKIRVRRFKVDEDDVEKNLKKFHDKHWDEFNKVKKYKIDDFAEKIEDKGVYFEGKKIDGENGLKLLLEQAGIRLIQISSLEKKLDEKDKRTKEEKVAENQKEEKDWDGKEQENGREKKKGGLFSRFRKGKKEQESAQSGEKNEEEKEESLISMNSVAKKIAITAATTAAAAAVSAVATPAAGAL